MATIRAQMRKNKGKDTVPQPTMPACSKVGKTETAARGLGRRGGRGSVLKQSLTTETQEKRGIKFYPLSQRQGTETTRSSALPPFLKGTPRIKNDGAKKIAEDGSFKKRLGQNSGKPGRGRKGRRKKKLTTREKKNCGSKG